MTFTLDDDEEVPSPSPPSPGTEGVEATESSESATSITGKVEGAANTISRSGETDEVTIQHIQVEQHGSIAPLVASSLADAMGLIKDNSTDIAETQVRLKNPLIRQTALLTAEKLFEQQKVLVAVRSHLGCCLAWKCLEVDNVTGCEVLQQMVGVIAELTDEDSAFLRNRQYADPHTDPRIQDPSVLQKAAEHFAYWLGILTTLLALTHHQLGLKGLAYLKQQQEQILAAQQQPEQPSAISEGISKIGAEMSSFKERMAAAWSRGLKKVTGKDEEDHGNAPPLDGSQRSRASADGGTSSSTGVKSEAVDFRLKIDALTVKVYGALRDAFKKQLASILPACIQLFNQLLLRPECCSASNIRFVAEGLYKLDAWLMAADNDEYLAALFNDLKHIRQTAVRAYTENPESTEISSTYDSPTPSNPPLPQSSSPPELPPSSGHANKSHMVLDDVDKAAQGESQAAEEGGAVREEGDTNPNVIGSAPLFPPSSITGVDMVSGEVLEAFGDQGVSHNGGLIVTFLLDEDTKYNVANPSGDEDTKHIVANPSGVGVSLQVLQLVHDKMLYKGIPVPDCLSKASIPAEVFAFLIKDMPLAIA
eukprot:gene5804-6089_t